MSLGIGIFLVVIGAILAFALNFTVEWINLQLVGTILMIAGAAVIIISAVLIARRRSAVSTSRTAVDPVSGERVTRSEHVTSGDDTAV